MIAAVKRLSIASRLFLLQLVVVLLISAVVGVLLWMQSRGAVEAQAEARSVEIALSIADNPFVVDAVQSEDPSAVLQPYAEDLMADTGVDFVTIMDTDRTRYTHRDPDQIGQSFIGTIVPALDGETFTETSTGTIGPSVRAVAPIRNADGTIVALVSAGVTISNVAEVFSEQIPYLAAAALSVLALGALACWLLSRYLTGVTGSRGPEELARMFDYYESVLHSVREGLVLVDENGYLVLYNDQAAEMLDLPLGERGGALSVSEQEFPAGIAELLESGRQAVNEVYLTAEHLLVVNQERAIAHGRAASRGLGGWVMTLRDHTELEKLSGDLQSMKTMSDALRSQTHEHSNRLHTITSLLELDRVPEALALVSDELSTAQRLADRMVGSVDEPVLSALFLGKSAQAHERGIEFHLDADPELGRLSASPNAVVTIVGNLIDNAMDAAAGSSPWVEVFLGLGTASGDPSDLIVQVSDSGPGIPADEVDRAFTMGYSTKEADAYGRGYGLALVKQAVERLGGSIEVVSEPHSSLTVTLPRTVTIRKEPG